MKKRLYILLPLVLALLCAVSCGRSDLTGCYRAGTGEDALLGPSLALNKDGTFSYSPSMISSYMGVGRYTRERDRVTLIFDEEETGLFTLPGEEPVSGEASPASEQTAVFTVTKEGLRFVSADSTAWALDGLEDGTLFVRDR